MMVGIGTEDIDVDDPDFMEMMIGKDGKIEQFSLPIGKDDYQRHYQVKPSHYGKMKTQNQTNESYWRVATSLEQMATASMHTL